MDVLQALPRDLASVRHILFTLPAPFSLSIADYKLFWPLIDNVYAIRQSRDVTGRWSPDKLHFTPAHKYHYVICRFKRTRDASPSLSQASYANTTKRAIKLCDVRLQIRAFLLATVPSCDLRVRVPCANRGA